MAIRYRRGFGLGLLVLSGQLLAGPASAASPIFTEEAASAGLDFVHANGMPAELDILGVMAPGAALLDFDDDGDLDVYLVQGPAHGDRLFRNDLELSASRKLLGGCQG